MSNYHFPREEDLVAAAKIDGRRQVMLRYDSVERAAQGIEKFQALGCCAIMSQPKKHGQRIVLASVHVPGRRCLNCDYDNNS